MGQKTVRFSDLSGQLIMDNDMPARIVVQEHPELANGPVEIEALTGEVQAIEKAALRVAVVELYLPGGEIRRVTLEAAAFDKLATDTPMSELLISARPARRAPRATAAAASPRSERADYSTIEHAGKPHRGKVTDEEKQLVRGHLDEINERLAAQGIRTISLTDPEHVERYGLADLVGKEQAAA